MLRPFLADAARVLALMPGPQGVMPWPAGEANRCVLVEETRWPIEAGSVDRLIVGHGLETCDSPEALLSEIWRDPRPRRPRRLHRPEPLRPLGAARRHPLRLRPPLQLRPARGAAAPAPLRPGAPRRRPLRAALAPQVPAADRLLLGAPRPPLRAAHDRRRAPRRGLQAGLRPPARLRAPGSPSRARSTSSKASPGQPRAGPRPRPPRPRHVTRKLTHRRCRARPPPLG